MRRDWEEAIEFHLGPGAKCVGCGRGAAVARPLELAHLVGRRVDRRPPLGWPEDEPWREPYVVLPTRVALLCGPATQHGTCHWRYDGARGEEALDLLGKLTLGQELQAVADAGSLFAAYRRLTGGRLP